jgi:plasmid stabilization system protein ParE
MSRRECLTAYARADLKQIFPYIGRDNPGAAEYYIRALHECCQCYAGLPFIGHAEPLIASACNSPPRICAVSSNVTPLL